MASADAGSVRRLTVCVDDVGLHAGVNAAALALWRQGRVSSWSVLVDGPAAAEVVRPVDAGATLEIGWHLNLTEALPGAGFVRPLPRLIADAYCGRLSGTERARLAEEIARQWHRFLALFGHAPEFIDGHQHVHQLPGVREVLLALLVRENGTGHRPWIRRCTPPQRFGADGVKPAIVGALGAQALSRAARAAGLRQNRHLLGVRPLVPGASAYRAQLERWLARAGEGDLLMVHPASPSAAVDDPLLAVRVAEFTVLSGAAFGRSLALHRCRVRPLMRG